MYKKIFDKEKLKLMFSMQKDLNDFTNGKCWIDGKTEAGASINWSRCTRFEIVEAIEQSFHWKHWKNTKGVKHNSIKNKYNLKIEMIDAWHFMMSEIIRIKLVNESIDLLLSDSFKPNNIKEDEDIMLDLESLEKMIMIYELDECKNEQLLKIVEVFWKITLSLIDFDEFSSIYILKNTLNIFRQNNGYKDDTYIKLWGDDKIEDNEFLNKYTEENEEIDFDQIYAYLETQYNTLNK